VILPDVQLSSGFMWLATAITAVLCVPVVLVLARRVPPDSCRRLYWPIALAAALFWLTLGMVLFALTWEAFYAKFLPDPTNRSLARSLLEMVPYPPIALGMWWLAGRLPGNPSVNFCLLGGLQALPEHLWGIYRLGMLESVPFLQEASAASVLAFAIPEYVLYWATVLSMAIAIEAAWRRSRRWWVSRLMRKAA
jgi:hypothetical protein